MKFMLISPKNRTVYNFRGDLLKDLSAKGFEIIVTGPDLSNVEKIKALGARFAEISMEKNGTDPAKDLRYFLCLLNLIKKEKPDIVMGYTAKPVIYGLLAAKAAGVPGKYAMITGIGYVYTSNSTKARVIRFLLSPMYRMALWAADRVIFQNPDNRDLFIKEKLAKREKCALVHGSGVNIEHFTPLPYPDRITFFMLSRIMFSKGVREYLKAAEIVKAIHPEVRFILLGAVEGIQDSMRQEEIDDYVRRGIIEYFGETEDVRPYYGMCSVYVLPSYAEGTPRTVLEAMCTARPVITTDAPGCRETVSDGKTGFLVPVRDADAVAAKMMEFIENPDYIAVMGKEARKYVEQKYDVRKVNKRLMDIMGI